MSNKKGALTFNVILVGMLVFVLIYAWINLTSKYSNFDQKIGEKQYSLINTYAKAESALFYIDQSAKYSLQQAVYDLAHNGGTSEIEYEDIHIGISKESEGKCGKYFGYSVWYEIKKEDSGFIETSCFDKELLNDYLLSSFDRNLNAYLLNHPNNIPIDNYNYEIRGSFEIIGRAISPLHFDILKDIKVAKYDSITTKKLQIEPTSTTPAIHVSDKYNLEAPSRPNNILIDRIILHHTGDDAAGKTYQTLKNRKLSVHYIIDRDGTIYYVVDELKMAQHAKGWNARSIGIEVVNTGYYDMEYTDAQYKSVNNLINDIASRWPSIKADNEHVIGHYEATTGKWDPSPNFEWARIGLQGHTTLTAEGKKPPREFGYV